MADRIVFQRAPDRIVTGANATRVVQGGATRIVTGARGLPGLSGAGYAHVQSSAATEWTVNHNLGFRPSVTVLSPGGIEVFATVLHLSTNQTRITFAAAQSGTARFV